MSVNLLSNYLATNQVDNLGLNIRQAELGWPHVRRGLRLILLGHYLWIIAVVAVVGVLLNLSSITRPLNAVPGSKVNWREIGLWVALFALAIVAIFSYGLILAGHWKCLSAPERNGCKNLIFACLTCVVMVPLLNIAASTLGGRENLVLAKQGLGSWSQMKFSSTMIFLHVASAMLGVASSVLFILFLRSVLRCFNDTARVWLVDLYLVFTGFLVAGTIYLNFVAGGLHLPGEAQRLADNPAHTPGSLQLLVLVGLGWVAALIWYLFLVNTARGSIARGYQELHRSPLETTAEALPPTVLPTPTLAPVKLGGTFPLDFK